MFIREFGFIEASEESAGRGQEDTKKELPTNGSERKTRPVHSHGDGGVDDWGAGEDDGHDDDGFSSGTKSEQNAKGADSADEAGEQ